jgi:hypothetical protein
MGPEGVVEFEIPAAQLPTPRPSFVADDCLVDIGRESVAFVFAQALGPTVGRVTEVLSIRMRRAHAVAFHSTFSAHFRQVLSACATTADHAGLDIPDFDGPSTALLVEYATVRVGSAEGYVRFYRFDEIRPGDDSVRVYPVVQILTFPGVVQKMVVQLDAAFGVSER